MILLACVGLFGPARAQDASLPNVLPGVDDRQVPNGPLSIRPSDGDCPDFRGARRENGTVPLQPEGDRHIYRPETGRQMSQSPAPLETLAGGPTEWTRPEKLGSTIQVMLLLGVLSLAPALLLMTTCFVRVVVVLSLLRQAIGAQQLPPTQVITTLALFVTLLVMTPTWKEVYQTAIAPYSEKQIELDEAWRRGVKPIRQFMCAQIERTGNTDDIYLFLDYLPDQPTPTDYDEVPLQVLLPAFMLSELKTAFLIGFQIYLPFVILDMVVGAVMVSMGMLMLPPVVVSLPLKILLFVLVDGWHLVVGMLLQSFAFT
jgi:flagellar biosynthetic protein FliP